MVNPRFGYISAHFSVDSVVNVKLKDYGEFELSFVRNARRA